MIFRNLTANGDWTFGKGANNYLTGEAALDMNIRTRLLSWVGDCYFSLTDFMDWKSLLDVGQQSNVLAAAKSVILQSEGVVGIVSAAFVFAGQTRRESVQALIQTIYSPSAQITVTIPPVGSA